ncbi:MAG: PulJ/GspJ family protein [Thermodesulfobacteriota bacterium]
MIKGGLTPYKSSQPGIEIPKQVRDDNKAELTPSCHAELVSASDLNETTGFTLIEVVITLTILGFICLILFSSLRLGLSAWERGESLKDEYQKVRMVSQLITQQVKSAVPYKIKPQKAEGDYLAFEGDARSLKFVSALPIRGKRPEGFVYARYEFKGEGSEGGRLIVYEERVLNKDFFAEEPKEERAVALLEGVSNIRLEYLREADPLKNQEEEWVEEWQAKDEKRLPKALKMTIILKNQKGKEEAPISLLASLPANRFEEVGTMPRRRIPGMSVIRR